MLSHVIQPNLVVKFGLPCRHAKLIQYSQFTVYIHLPYNDLKKKQLSRLMVKYNVSHVPCVMDAHGGKTSSSSKGAYHPMG